MAAVSHVKDTVKEGVKHFYGKKLHDESTENIQNATAVTSKYCSARKVPANIKEALKLCHDKVVSRYYGCGLVFPECIKGGHILDLGCGAGRDCFILSQLVGENGHVTGVDLTQEALDTANKYVAYHAEKFGFSTPNTDFKLGDIEDLDEAGIPDNTIDVIISNCVVDLATDKTKVLREARRVLKDGGEMYFSDMYADRVVSEKLKTDEILWGEGLAGALYWKSLVDICKDVGLSGPYLVDADMMTVTIEEIRKILGDTRYVSATYRLFNVERQDESTEFFEATYKGSVEEQSKEFKFDIHTVFKTGEPKRVPATLADILRQSRFAKHFDVTATTVEAGAGEAGPDAYVIADPFIGL